MLSTQTNPLPARLVLPPSPRPRLMPTRTTRAWATPTLTATCPSAPAAAWTRSPRVWTPPPRDTSPTTATATTAWATPTGAKLPTPSLNNKLIFMLLPRLTGFSDTRDVTQLASSRNNKDCILISAYYIWSTIIIITNTQKCNLHSYTASSHNACINNNSHKINN